MRVTSAHVEGYYKIATSEFEKARHAGKTANLGLEDVCLARSTAASLLALASERMLNRDLLPADEPQRPDDDGKP